MSFLFSHTAPPSFHASIIHRGNGTFKCAVYHALEQAYLCNKPLNSKLSPFKLARFLAAFFGELAGKAF